MWMFSRVGYTECLSLHYWPATGELNRQIMTISPITKFPHQALSWKLSVTYSKLAEQIGRVATVSADFLPALSADRVSIFN